MPASEKSRQFLDQPLLTEGAVMEEVRADAATYVRRRAVDEVEVQIFLDMLGIHEETVEAHDTDDTDLRHQQAILHQRRVADQRRVAARKASA